jgi:hypothetical protein
MLIFFSIDSSLSVGDIPRKKAEILRRRQNRGENQYK